MKPIEYSHVFVIESLREDDEKTGSALFNDIIHRRMMQHGYENQARFLIVNSRAHFFNAMELIRQIEIYELANPIIHFEMHGDENGLELSDGSRISWLELQIVLLQINSICGNNLFVTMATCKGGYIFKAISPRLWTPFWGFMGAFDIIYGQETLADYTVFYEEFLYSNNFDRALTALRESNADQYSKFRFLNTELIFRKAYSNYEVSHLTPDRIEERVEELFLLCRPLPEFNDWGDQRIKDFFVSLITDETGDLKSRLMRKFFMIDRFPEHATYYDF